MSIFVGLCSFALKSVGVNDVEHMLEGFENAFDKVLGFAVERLSDQGQRFYKALRESNEKAWKALEIALAGESLWNLLDKAEDKAFRKQISGFVESVKLPADLSDKKQFRQQCLKDIHGAKKKALLIGRLVPDELKDR